MGIIVGFSTIWFKEITDENPIWPLLRGNNSKRLPYPAGNHPEINDHHIYFLKNISQHPQLGVGGGIMVGFSTIWLK